MAQRTLVERRGASTLLKLPQLTFEGLPPLTAARPWRTIAAAGSIEEVMVGTEAVLGLLVPPFLVIGFLVGLQLISRFEEAREQADEARRIEREVGRAGRRRGGNRSPR